MFQDIVLLILGLILLVAGGHFLVNAGVSAARKFKIAPFIVGATVIAFGTSAPELLVSVNAAISGHPEIALGNVIGSNIANIALVLGATSCLITLPIISHRLFSDWLLVMVTSILLLVFLHNGNLSTLEGYILIAILVVYIISAIRHPKVENEDEENGQLYHSWVVIAFVFVVSGIGLAIGANALVRGASNIARVLNISERVISITIVAFGTSLPELATSLIAAFKKQTDISIGNIIGSNLFNILAVLGITAVIKPLQISFPNFEYDLIIMIGVAFLLFFLIYPLGHNIKAFKENKQAKAFLSLTNGKLSYIGGIILLLAYVTYIYLLF